MASIDKKDSGGFAEKKTIVTYVSKLKDYILKTNILNIFIISLYYNALLLYYLMLTDAWEVMSLKLNLS